MEKKILISGIIVFLFLGVVSFVDGEVLARFEREESYINANDYFYDGGFALSAAPGFHDEEFYLSVSIPSIPQATIYWTIDGSEPNPIEESFIDRGEVSIQVSGRLESGQIFVADRTSHWRNAILMYHSEKWIRTNNPDWFCHTEGVLPIDDADILRGTAFRFRGFIRGVPVTETITATYIIEPNASTRFNEVPVVMIVAPYEDFLAVYGNTSRSAGYRRIFNYEYFTYSSQEGYVRRFNLPGSSSLGGQWSRAHEQRTINVHLSRGELNGVITYPIFENLDELYRVRLWNGGNAFTQYLIAKDNFAQTASSDLNVLFSGCQLAIKFINGEFWGFTVLREHTSNEDFIVTRTGLDRGNVLIVDRGTGLYRLHEGNENLADLFLDELVSFATQADMSTDEAREQLFDEFFDQENFIDYIIANTFFLNNDWLHHNVRLFRAVIPSSNNLFGDGKWRYILHDMDHAPGVEWWIEPVVWSEPSASNFSLLYSATGAKYHLQIFNNPAFVQKFVDRAHYVLVHYFYVERLYSLHNEFLEAYRPLLVDMYERFRVCGSVQNSLDFFELNAQKLTEFINRREYYYRQQLDYLLGRVGLK